MNIQPLEDRIVIKSVEAEEQTKGGIYLPDTAQEKPQEGEVVATGPGKHADNGELIKMAVTVGDRVIYGKYSPTEIKIDGEEYLIIKESDIYAILK